MAERGKIILELNTNSHSYKYQSAYQSMVIFAFLLIELFYYQPYSAVVIPVTLLIAHNLFRLQLLRAPILWNVYDVCQWKIWNWGNTL